MRKISFQQVQVDANFDPAKIATRAISVGSMKIDPMLDANKIREALLKLQTIASDVYSKLNDFKYAISDTKAREFGINPSGGLAWFTTGYPDCVFFRVNELRNMTPEQVASTLAHEHKHRENPNAGEGPAEQAGEEVFKRLYGLD